MDASSENSKLNKKV